ncbi:hypothetical protein ABPG75_011711 [Micractinium tetrahymenae]
MGAAGWKVGWREQVGARPTPVRRQQGRRRQQRQDDPMLLEQRSCSPAPCSRAGWEALASLLGDPKITRTLTDKRCSGYFNWNAAGDPTGSFTGAKAPLQAGATLKAEGPVASCG